MGERGKREERASGKGREPEERESGKVCGVCRCELVCVLFSFGLLKISLEAQTSLLQECFVTDTFLPMPLPST